MTTTSLLCKTCRGGKCLGFAFAACIKGEEGVGEEREGMKERDRNLHVQVLFGFVACIIGR